MITDQEDKEPLITKAWKALKFADFGDPGKLNERLYFVCTYLGKAYRPTDKDGIICYKGLKVWQGSWGWDEEMFYYVQARNYLWDQWYETIFHRPAPPKQKLGLTIKLEFYNDMQADKPSLPSELIIYFERNYHYFKIKDLYDYIEYNQAFHYNSRLNYDEVGFPISLAYRIKPLPNNVMM